MAARGHASLCRRRIPRCKILPADEFLIGTALAPKRRAQSSSDCSGADHGDQVAGRERGEEGTLSGLRNQTENSPRRFYRWIMFINGSIARCGLASGRDRNLGGRGKVLTDT